MRPDWDNNAYYHRLLLRHLPRPCGRVLDVGCGAGNFAAELAQHAENVDALDRSPAMIEVARRVTPPAAGAARRDGRHREQPAVRGYLRRPLGIGPRQLVRERTQSPVHAG